MEGRYGDISFQSLRRDKLSFPGWPETKVYLPGEIPDWKKAAFKLRNGVSCPRLKRPFPLC